MNLRIRNVLGIRSIVHRAASSDVPLFKEITLPVLTYEHPDPDVKLASVNQKRVLHVLLDYEGTGLDVVVAA